MIQKILIILALTTIGSHLCLADYEAVFTSYPSNTIDHNKWIVRDVNPGENYEEYLTVKNLSDKNIKVKLNTVETTGPKENIRVLDNQEPKNIGNWIGLENQFIELQANQKKDLKISISIPEKAATGEYQAAVFATYTDESNRNLNTTTRIGNRIYLNVTNNHSLYTNTFSPNINITQLSLIIFSILGIIISSVSLKLDNKKSMS